MKGERLPLNGVRIGRVERFFLGDATEDGPVPVLVEINRKLVRRHMVEGEMTFLMMRVFSSQKFIATCKQS